MEKVAIVIPARLESSRLPNKIIKDIGGKILLQRVVEQTQKANVGDVFVAVTNEETANLVKSYGATPIITAPEIPSGTDRVYSAICSLPQKYDFAVNIQGDMPFVDPTTIAKTVQELLKGEADIVTPIYKIEDERKINQPSVVKVVQNSNGEAIYFSRNACPHNAPEYFGHIGIYGYKWEALEKFVNAPQSALEKCESLEQLRAFDLGLKFKLVLADNEEHSVDTPEDYELACKIANSSNY